MRQPVKMKTPAAFVTNEMIDNSVSPKPASEYQEKQLYRMLRKCVLAAYETMHARLAPEMNPTYSAYVPDIMVVESPEYYISAMCSLARDIFNAKNSYNMLVGKPSMPINVITELAPSMVRTEVESCIISDTLKRIRRTVLESSTTRFANIDELYLDIMLYHEVFPEAGQSLPINIRFDKDYYGGKCNDVVAKYNNYIRKGAEYISKLPVKPSAKAAGAIAASVNVPSMPIYQPNTITIMLNRNPLVDVLCTGDFARFDVMLDNLCREALRKYQFAKYGPVDPSKM